VGGYRGISCPSPPERRPSATFMPRSAVMG
jgi:hypothetical protein